MNALTLNTQAPTMTSLELVQFINTSRQPGDAELRHDHFMVKVPKVLGEANAPNFRDIYVDARNREQACYRFPKREACLMAMSYSYELQARVFDRMTALEAQAAPAIPRTFVEAMRVALAQAEALEKAQAEVQALKPAALVGERVAAHKHTLEQIVRSFPGVYCEHIGFRYHSPPWSAI